MASRQPHLLAPSLASSTVDSVLAIGRHHLNEHFFVVFALFWRRLYLTRPSWFSTYFLSIICAVSRLLCGKNRAFPAYFRMYRPFVSLSRPAIALGTTQHPPLQSGRHRHSSSHQFRSRARAAMYFWPVQSPVPLRPFPRPRLRLSRRFPGHHAAALDTYSVSG